MVVSIRSPPVHGGSTPVAVCIVTAPKTHDRRTLPGPMDQFDIVQRRSCEGRMIRVRIAYTPKERLAQLTMVLLVGGVITAGVLGLDRALVVLAALLVLAIGLLQVEARARHRLVHRLLISHHESVVEEQKLFRRNSQVMQRKQEALQTSMENLGPMLHRLNHQFDRASTFDESMQARQEDTLDLVRSTDMRLRASTERATERWMKVNSLVESAGRAIVNQTLAGTQLTRRIPEDLSLPQFGGWAADASVVLRLTHIITLARSPLVVECGSGTSTLWLAYAAQRAGGRVVALEHEPRFAEMTRRTLTEHGLHEVAEVRDAPLSIVSMDGAEYEWYAPEALHDLKDVGVVFVDGPPKWVAPDSRYPALPMLSPLLAVGAHVVLDDAFRPGEREVVRRWLETFDLEEYPVDDKSLRWFGYHGERRGASTSPIRPG